MSRARTKYTRAELIAICEQASVPEAKWHDRDSESAQRQAGDCWSLLRAGCAFEVLADPTDSCCTDHETIWLYTYSRGFNWFEGSLGDDEEDLRTRELHYLPTPKRLAEREGQDWY